MNCSRRRSPACREAGFTLVEVVVAVVILGVVSAMVLGGLLYAMTEARRGKARASAAAWVQAELDYLRSQGYAGLADDVAAGTRTLTQTSGYTTYGALAEPPIPEGADRAVVRVENVPGLSLRAVIVALYDDPGPTPSLVVRTHVTSLAAVSPPR